MNMDPGGARAAEAASYRRIFSSTSVIGGASVVNVVIGLVRVKLVAVLLGPAGIGLIGLYTALMTTAATVAQLGMGTVGTRQIAEAFAAGDAGKIAIARRALFVASLALCAAGALGMWLFADVLARWVLGDASATGVMAWLAVGVALSVAAASQTALIRGMRRIRDLALISIFSAVLTTIVGVPLVWWFGERAIAAFVVLTPLCAFVLGHVFVARLPKSQAASVAWADLPPQWAMFLRLGLPFMGSALAGVGITLLLRMDVQRQLGIEALGHFQAAWTIAMHYVGFVLGAMAADYYPRLTGEIGRPEDAGCLVNQQTEVALLLAGPVILVMVAFAPWVIALLYTRDFAEAAPMLQWMALGTALKVASWPLGFVILAAGAGGTYFWTETLTLVFMLAVISLLIPYHGLEGAGIGYAISYLVYLPAVYVLAMQRIGFAWTREVRMTLGGLGALTVAVFMTARLAPDAAPWVTAAALALFAVHMIRRLRRMGLDRFVADARTKLAGAPDDIAPRHN